MVRSGSLLYSNYSLQMGQRVVSKETLGRLSSLAPKLAPLACEELTRALVAEGINKYLNRDTKIRIKKIDPYLEHILRSQAFYLFFHFLLHLGLLRFGLVLLKFYLG